MKKANHYKKPTLSRLAPATAGTVHSAGPKTMSQPLMIMPRTTRTNHGQPAPATVWIKPLKNIAPAATIRSILGRHKTRYKPCVMQN